MANEYVAACGDSGKVYKFECNADAGLLYYYPNGDGTIDGNYTGNKRAEMVGIYHPCGEKHEASTKNVFYDGFVDYNLNGKYNEGEGVIVWLGPKNDNGHATKNLNMEEWETSKS